MSDGGSWFTNDQHTLLEQASPSSCWLYVYARRRRNKDGTWKTTIRQLTQNTPLSQHVARRALRELTKLGLLTLIKQGTRGQPTTWALPMDDSASQHAKKTDHYVARRATKTDHSVARRATKTNHSVARSTTETDHFVARRATLDSKTTKKAADGAAESRPDEGGVGNARDERLDALERVQLGSADYLLKEFPATKAVDIKAAMRSVSMGAKIGARVQHFRQHIRRVIEEREQREAQREAADQHTRNRLATLDAETKVAGADDASDLPKQADLRVLTSPLTFLDDATRRMFQRLNELPADAPLRREAEQSIGARQLTAQVRQRRAQSRDAPATGKPPPA